MIVLQHAYGSLEWIEARLAIPTASEFDKIVTAGGKFSEQSRTYMYAKLAEYFVGEQVNVGSSAYMERGKELEPAAIADYEWEHRTEVEPGRLVLRDDGKCGASPDGFVGAAGLLESKEFGIVNHVGRCLADGSDYRVQVQGQLYVCGREWCDRYSHNASFPSQTVRVFRDEEFIAKLAAGLNQFIERFEAARDKLLADGWQRLGLRCPVGGVKASICRCASCEARRKEGI